MNELSMKNRVQPSMKIVLAALLGLIAVSRLEAREVVPATVNDIVSAIGMDAKGLHLTQDKLPDLFTLTASRLEENPKTFVVQQPYLEGRWVGGKAVIEYARDLSYTMVSIYDKSGRRQRIYSVISKSEVSSEDRQRYEAAVSAAVSNSDGIDRTVVEVASVPGDVANPGTRGVPIGATPFMADSTSRLPAGGGYLGTNPVGSATRARTTSRRSTSGGTSSESGFVWDESKGMYVATGKGVSAAAESLKEPEPRSTKQRWQKASAKSEAPKTTSSSAAPSETRMVPVSSAKTPEGYVWDERTGVYVPVGSEKETAAVPAAVAVPVDEPKETTSKNAKKSKKRKTDETPSQPIDVASNPPPTNTSNVWLPAATKAEVVPQPPPLPMPSAAPADNTPPPAKTSARAASSVSAPGGGYEWDENAGAYVPRIQAATSKASPVAPTRNWAPAREAASAAPAAPAPSKGSEAVDSAVPSTEELLGTAAPAAATPPAPAVSRKEPERVVTAVSEPPIEKSPETKKSSWWHKSKAAPEPPAPTVAQALAQIEAEERAAKARAASRATAPASVTPPSRDIAEPPADEKSGPDTSEGDAWIPKPVTRKAAPEPEIPAAAPVKVAMLPKPAPVDNSIDAILKAAAKSQQAAMPNESEAWVPKGKVSPSNTDAEIAAELERVRKAKPAPARPVVKINRDVNNPEEGVLPVSQFEKFEGPRYGRHREYERRFFYGKRAKAPITDYDFYVDEVDRKKEIHNVYYYKKEKIPKLVAVEKHDRVTFLSNYDVEKEDKGKVIKY